MNLQHNDELIPPTIRVSEETTLSEQDWKEAAHSFCQLLLTIHEKATILDQQTSSFAADAVSVECQLYRDFLNRLRAALNHWTHDEKVERVLDEFGVEAKIVVNGAGTDLREEMERAKAMMPKYEGNKD